MGGVDAIVFTGGIGENSPDVRAESCKGLEFLGVSIDAERNNSAEKEKMISADSAKVKVFALPTNEELVIALDTMRSSRRPGTPRHVPIGQGTAFLPERWSMKKLILIVSAVAIAAGVAYIVVKTAEELRFEQEEDLTPEDVESQLLQHE